MMTHVIWDTLKSIVQVLVEGFYCAVPHYVIIIYYIINENIKISSRLYKGRSYISLFSDEMIKRKTNE